ncbi:MAG: hypothetical protein WCA79_04045 [Anaerolineales bacterium]
MIDNLLLWLQQHIKHWTKPATAVLISGLLTNVTRSRSDLIVENALLRQQLIVLHRQIKRPQGRPVCGTACRTIGFMKFIKCKDSNLLL